MALSFATFINPIGGEEAIEAYYKMFQPSAQLSSPQASAGIFVFCGESEEKVARMQKIMDYRLFSILQGKTDGSPSYDSVKDFHYSPDEWRHVLFNRQRMIVGTPDIVKAGLEQLASRYRIGEIVVATFAENFEDRVRSYELLTEIIEVDRSLSSVAIPG
jgi:alkanesulfonate monooxygenase SsuD/methylene tetrahydromethanopterin reductase-like flavin-dependent oxidoreductase (luciferase family)